MSYFRDMDDRIKTAVDFLKDGHLFVVNEVQLSTDNSGSLVVMGWLNTFSEENITKRMALSELEAIKSEFMEMVDNSNDLKEFLSGKNIKFKLAYKYGMGSIGICEETGGVISWDMNIK